MKQKKRILIADSTSSQRTQLFRTLSRSNYQVITTLSVEEAKKLLQTDTPLELAIFNWDLLESQEMSKIKDLMEIRPHLKGILIAPPLSPSIAASPSLMNLKALQAHPSILHTFTSPIHLEQLLEKVHSLLGENLILTPQAPEHCFKDIIGYSTKIKNVLQLVEKVSQSDSTILITGESGTGKELVARAIHLNSSRAKFPFIAINCGAIPSELLESELFGHVKGAFTNAVSNRTGRFELADSGTIFFDEIGDMSPQLQVKLLRVLQEKTFEPIGGTKTIRSNVRIITATHVNLEKAVAEGRFREDLYYRLNVIPIYIPPLKERVEDIPILLEHFMRKFNHGHSKKMAGITPEALESLTQYNWPGNIRELENLIERLTILKGEGLIEVHDLPPNYNSLSTPSLLTGDTIPIELPSVGMDFNACVDAYENTLIMQALEKTGWNRNQAAILLRLNRTTLVEKIKKRGFLLPTPIPPLPTEKILLRKRNPPLNPLQAMVSAHRVNERRGARRPRRP